MRKLLIMMLISSMVLTPLSSFKAFAQSKTITVQLSYYIGNKTSISFTSNNSYTSSAGDSITKGNNYTISASGNTLNLYENNILKKSVTSSLTLTPSAYDVSHYLTLSGHNYLGTMKFQIENGYIRPYNTLDSEDYLKGVVPSEMSNSWNAEALKAQAVAARTFASEYTSSYITDTPSDQAYGGYYPNDTNSNSAVDATKGLYLTYNKTPIYAAYSSSNGGYILSETNSWGTSTVPYLQFKKDPFDVRSASLGNSDVNWNFTLHKQQIDLSGKDPYNQNQWWSGTNEMDQSNSSFQNLKNYVASKVGISANNIKIIDIPTLSFTSINSITASNTKLMGNLTVDYVAYGDASIKSYTISRRSYDFRTILGDYLGPMKSPSVESATLNNGVYTIAGHGWGHGIGMSQWGADEMGKEGYSYQDILGFYYPGTSLYDGTSYTALATPSTSSPAPVVEPLAISNVSSSVSSDNTLHLSFSTNHNGNVSVDILDSTGKVVDTAQAVSWVSAGVQKVDWNAGELNGNYTYSIRAADGTSVVYASGEAVFYYAVPGLSNVSTEVDEINHLHVHYSVNATSNVTISLVNSQNQVAATIQPTTNKAAGNYTFDYDSSALSGNYTVNVTAENTFKTETQSSPVTFVKAAASNVGVYQAYASPTPLTVHTLFYLYNQPSDASVTTFAVAPQTVTALGYMVDAQNNTWYKINSYLGPKWIKPMSYNVTSGSFPITTYQVVPLYNANHTTGSAISAIGAQTVTATFRDGDWFLINTWIGPKWIHLSPNSYTIGTPENISTTAVTTQKIVKMYTNALSNPSYDHHFDIAPQTVQAFQKWINPESSTPQIWYKIKSYVGDSWIQM